MQITKNSIITTLLLFVITITSCNMQDNPYARQAAESDANKSNQAPLATQQDQFLSDAEEFIDQERMDEANDILNNIDPNELTDRQSTKFYLLQAKLFINSKDSEIANVEQQNIPVEISSPPVVTTAALPFQDNVINHEDLAQQDNKILWQKIITQDKSTINNLLTKYTKDQNSINNRLTGWLQLAQISQNPEGYTTDDYVQQIKNWQNQHSDHPANSYLYNVATNPNLVKKIAVLLPLSGNFAPAAKAIRDGILTGYYTDNNYIKPEIIIIDTKNDNENNIQEYYDQAIRRNADLIIGPLNKKSVSYLQKYASDQVPIIALNYIPDDLIQKNRHNFYQFGISAEDEANQAAIKIWQSGYTKSVVFVDDNEWGYRVSQTFKDKLQSLTQETPKITFLSSKSNFKKLIYTNLGLQESQQRKKTLQSIINHDLAFEPRIRKDFDNIFLATSTADARQLKPILKFNYADNIPVFATSNILDYKSTNDETLLKDLAGIQYCDIPLIIHQESQNKMLKLQNENFKRHEKLIRLYALGIDAYNLSYNINKLTIAPEIGISANTGHLLLKKSGKITRQLPWAKITNNKITSIEMI